MNRKQIEELKEFGKVVAKTIDIIHKDQNQKTPKSIKVIEDKSKVNMDDMKISNLNPDAEEFPNFD